MRTMYKFTGVKTVGETSSLTYEKMNRMHDLAPNDVCYIMKDDGSIFVDKDTGTVHYVYIEPNGVMEDGRQAGLFVNLIEAVMYDLKIDKIFSEHFDKNGKYGFIPSDITNLSNYSTSKLNKNIIHYENLDYILPLLPIATDLEHIKKAVEYWNFVHPVVEADYKIFLKKKKENAVTKEEV